MRGLMTYIHIHHVSEFVIISGIVGALLVVARLIIVGLQKSKMTRADIVLQPEDRD